MGNLHVVIVHFPVALLTIYAILEFVPWGRLQRDSRYEAVKGTFVTLGFLGAVIARQTGEMIAEDFHGVDRLIETHALFALMTTIFFGLITLAHVMSWLDKETTFIRQWIPERIIRFSHTLLTYRPVMMVFSIVGLVLITVTGALGGALAFGAATDPLAQFLYNLLVR